MLLSGNLFLYFRELHTKEQNKVSQWFINHSRKTWFWSYGVDVRYTHGLQKSLKSQKHKGSLPLTHESVEPLYVPQRNLASVWCPFLEIKSLWSERAHIFHFYLDAVAYHSFPPFVLQASLVCLSSVVCQISVSSVN